MSSRILSAKELRCGLEVMCAEYPGNVEKAANIFGVAYEQIENFANGKDVDIPLVTLNRIYRTATSNFESSKIQIK